MFTEQI